MQKNVRKHEPNADDRRRPPYIGAFLRLTYQATRGRLFKALTERGFTDLNPALLNVFVYPPPDGVRPTELAERLNMSKQALNYLLGQLESLGYVKRRAGKGAQRLVFLTRRGWQVFETQWEALQALEDEWSTRLGARKFEALKNTLRQLSSSGAPEPTGRA
jgi:DNA-binding MarR family transcriptional regulator